MHLHSLGMHWGMHWAHLSLSFWNALLMTKGLFPDLAWLPWLWGPEMSWVYVPASAFAGCAFYEEQRRRGFWWGGVAPVRLLFAILAPSCLSRNNWTEHILYIWIESQKWGIRCMHCTASPRVLSSPAILVTVSHWDLWFGTDSQEEELGFPLIADETREIASLLGMLVPSFPTFGAEMCWDVGKSQISDQGRLLIGSFLGEEISTLEIFGDD